MRSIPIFDSLAHPTVDGNWIMPRYKGAANLDNLQKQMKEANVKWAFAVGMEGIGSYSQKEYVEYLKDENGTLFPIAFYYPSDNKIGVIKRELSEIKKMGYVGIKLHPRISNFTIDENIAEIIKLANEFKLICMLCTYCYGDNLANRSTPESLMQMLSKTAGSKVILTHGGTVRLLEYMEIARAHNNVLLDLSFTLCKYKGSSLDLDIAFLFQQFDRRICIGSDFPEISLMQLRERFEFFANDISIEKQQNIAYRNIANFCDINI